MRQRPLNFGQFIMMGVPGLDLDAVTIDMIRGYGAGNFILFKRNIRDPAQVKRLCKSLEEVCRSAGLPRPIIAVDQEGGPVQRLGPPVWPAIPSNQDAAGSEDPAIDVRRQAGLAADILKDLGIRLNLAPVLDLAAPATSGVLSGRCYGSDPQETGRLGAIYIKELQGSGVGACAKHFPGIGRVKKDPHIERPVVSAVGDELLNDMIPFRMAVEQGVTAVMTSHVIFTALDPAEPATCSAAIARDLLRNELGFKGALITDDLEMGGAAGYSSVEGVALKAFLAGHDLLLICNDAGRVRKTVDALANGAINPSRLDEAICRLDGLREKAA